MNQELLCVDSIMAYNDLLGVETLHPLASVVDLSKARPMRQVCQVFGFYVIRLKDGNHDDRMEPFCGRRRCDCCCGTVVCVPPGQVVSPDSREADFRPAGWALCFDPELIRDTHLGRHIKDYSYFSCAASKALRLSEQERRTVMDSLSKINYELTQGIDRLSRRLIATNIELLLDYCQRFYERQLPTRPTARRDSLKRLE